MIYLRVHIEKATGSVLCVESSSRYQNLPHTKQIDEFGVEVPVEIVFLEVDDPSWKPAKYYVEKLEADGQKKIKWKDIVDPGDKKSLKETKRLNKED